MKRALVPIILVFAIVPGFASALGSTSAGPVIVEITPTQGNEREWVVIKGQNFGSPSLLVDPNHYVVFGGFLETEVHSWKDDEIVVVVPAPGASSGTLKSALSMIPGLSTAAKIVVKTIPIPVVKSPAESGTIVKISVVAPIGQSNEVEFTYSHNAIPKPISYYINNFVDALLHPVQTAQDWVTNKVQRVARIVNQSVVLPLGRWLSPAPAPVIVQHPSQTAGSNVQASADPQPAVTAQSGQVVQMPTPGLQPPAPVQSSKTVSGGEIPGKVTALVTDQFGNPLNDVKYWLVNPYGENVTYQQFTNENGRLQTDGKDGRAIPPGKYTLHVQKLGLYSGLEIGYEVLEMDIDLPAGGLWLGTLIIKKWPIVTGVLLDANGLPATLNSWRSPNSSNGYSLVVTIRGSDGKVADEFGCWLCSNPDSKSGRFQSDPLRAGHYSLKVSIPGGYGEGDYVMAERQFDAAYDKEEISLGNITVNGILFGTQTNN